MDKETLKLLESYIGKLVYSDITWQSIAISGTLAEIRGQYCLLTTQDAHFASERWVHFTHINMGTVRVL